MGSYVGIAAISAASVFSGACVVQISGPMAKKSLTGASWAIRSSLTPPSATTGSSIISDHHANNAWSAETPSPKGELPMGPKLI